MQTVDQIEINKSSVSKESVQSKSVKVDGLQDQLMEMADDSDVTGFKCVKCGLAHMHDTTKHRLSDTFDAVDESVADLMEYNSVCHCGVQEAGRHGSDFGIDESKAARIASDAPIPPESSREMNDQFGSL